MEMQERRYVVTNLQGREYVTPVDHAASECDLYPVSLNIEVELSEFAQLELTPESVLAFSEHYGLLGLQQVARRLGREDSLESYAEPLEDWYAAIMEARCTLDIADSIRKRDSGRIAQYVWWEANDCLVVVYPDGQRFRYQFRSPRPSLTRAAAHHLSARANYYIQDALVLSLSAEGPRPGAPSPAVFFSLTRAFRTLIGGMWLYFAMSLPEFHRSCRQCGNDIDPYGGQTEWSSRKRRSDVAYCSSACKKAAYRRRKKQGRLGDTDSPA